MKKSMVLLLSIAMIAAMSMSGCQSDGHENSKSSGATISAAGESDAAQQGFDIEAVRKAIIIKGHPFEIPVALKDLADGWTYELYPEEEVYLGEGLSFAHIYYDGEEMFVASLEDYDPDQPAESVVYNLTIMTDDCSVDGFVPLQSTKQEVVDRYGAPDETDSFRSPFLDSYSYGIISGYDENGGLNDQSVSFQFTEEGVVKAVSITYAD